MNILIAQLDSKLGAMQENLDKLEEIVDYELSLDIALDLVVLPPFYISGCPLKGLVYSESFLAELDKAHEQLAKTAKVPTITSSYVSSRNAQTGAVEIVEEKICLFRDGKMEIVEGLGDPFFELGTFKISGNKMACLLGDTYEVDVADVPLDADYVINLVDDTYDIQRDDLVEGDKISYDQTFAKSRKVWLVRSGLVGAQDSAVYPGGDYIITPAGELTGDTVLFDEAVLMLGLTSKDGDDWETSVEELDDRDYGFSVMMDESGIDNEMADWGAITLGIRDYIQKNGFSDVVIGLSGGIDSTVVAALAVDALGPDNVHGVLMPGQYSSDHSVSDSLDLAGRLGIDTVTIPINEPFDAFCSALAQPCGGSVEGSTRDNLQARIRTVYVMALSNQYGWVMLNTGNKSEAVMGYSTLYGDTAGAYAPLGNIYKTRVYELAEWRNEQSEVIPQNVIDKAPSAELHPGQKDQDTLPPYEILDGICELYLEYDYSADQIVSEGFDPKIVKRVLGALANNEYKRASEPAGPWIDGISIADDRAWPVTNAYRDVPAEFEEVSEPGEFAEAGEADA